MNLNFCYTLLDFHKPFLMPFKRTLIILTTAASLFPSLSSAEVSFGAGLDVIHAEDTEAVILRYDHRESRLGGHLMAWDGPEGTNGAIAADFNIGFGPLDLNLGGAWLADTSRINGTNVNFSLGAALNVQHIRIQFTHYSNGNNGNGHMNNTGWNFLLFLWRF